MILLNGAINMGYKYKVTRETSNGVVTVETDNHSLVMELCELPIKEIEVNINNESIDPEWQTILQKIKEYEERSKSIFPVAPSDGPIIPMTPEVYPGVYTEGYKDWLKRPYTVTC